MPEMEGNKYKWIIIISIASIMILLLLWNIFRHGQAGAMAVFKGFITSFFIILVIALVGVLIWFIFFFEKMIDITKEVFEGIKEECEVNSLENLGNLYLVGDKKHHGIVLGKIIGYSHRKSFKEGSNDEGDKYERESVFLVQLNKGGLFRKIFPKSVVVRVPERLHDHLQGDVGVQTVSLVKHGFYYYPSNLHLSMQYIDETINKEAIRYLNLAILKHFSPIINKGLGLTVKDIQSTEAKTGGQMIGDSVSGMRGK